MGELKSRALVRFLNADHQNRDPVLLQIRGIIPVMNQSHNLFPNHGFFLKLSDLSHAIHVSLPREDDDMVLSNELQLGQLVFVEDLEPAYPAPFVRGLKPIPGRHQCVGKPKDLYPNFESEVFLGIKHGARSLGERTRCLSKRRGRLNSNEYEYERDLESTVSSSCSSVSSSSITSLKRKSWNLEANYVSKCYRRNMESGKVSNEDFSSTIVEVFKDVKRKKELAFMGAVDSLQEAAFHQRWLNCLRDFLELVSTDKKDVQHAISMFLKLQDNLEDTKQIMEKRTQKMDFITERTHNAISWVNLAMECDLSPNLWQKHMNCKEKMNPSLVNNLITNKSQPFKCDIATTLENGCKFWFLTNVEEYLEWVKSQIFLKQSIPKVVKILMEMKKVSDWLEMKLERNEFKSDFEVEACGRLKNLICDILLKHVEVMGMRGIGKSNYEVG